MKKRKRRDVDIVVISDVHLGTYGCHAIELLQYLKTINPKKVVLNGDIIDMWQFSKRYWPKSHMQVIKHITGLITNGVRVYYITGNHDEMLRKFVGFKLGSFSIQNRVVLKTQGKSNWIFHGDVFDVTMKHSRWLAKLGAAGYDALIVLNRGVNFVNAKLGNGPISMSKRIKNSVKSAVKFINNFEATAADIAISNDYDYVICGHIHQPEMKSIKTTEGEVMYLNSGDWVENLTALEYKSGVWEVYRYHEDEHACKVNLTKEKAAPLETSQLFDALQKEFSVLKK